MTTTYPGAADSFTNPTTSSYLDNPSHSTQHANANDAIEAIETVLGTTAGTSVLKDFAAGQFPARVNAGGTIVQTLTGGTINSVTLGTPTITGVSVSSGTINNAVFGSPSITSGTLTSSVINGATLGSPSITSGTSTSHVLNTATVGTPAITGGTATSTVLNSNTIGTPTITGGTFTSGTINSSTQGTPSITGGTITGAVIGTNTIVGGTINTATVGTPTVTGGTWTTGTINASVIGTPGITGGSVNSSNIGSPTLTIGSDATGDLFYRSAAGTLARLAIGGTGQVLTVSSGTLPAWGAAGTAEAGITEIVTGTNLTGGTITTTGTIALAGTIQPTMIGTTLFQGGTVAAAVVGTSTITGGTATSTVLNSNTVGTPTITGGTWTTGTINSSLLGSPTMNGGTISGAVLIGTVQHTGGTVTAVMLGTNTIVGGTINTVTVGTPTATGGTWTSGTINTSALGTPTITRPKIVTSIDDSNGNEIIKTPATSSAVNEITVTNSGTASPPTISATGDDTNIDIKLAAKGSYGVIFPINRRGNSTTDWQGSGTTGYNEAAAYKQVGMVSIGASINPGATFGPIAVTYGRAYANNPLVMLSVNGGGDASQITCGAFSVGTAGFNIYGRNHSLGTATFAQVAWLSIGPIS